MNRIITLAALLFAFPASASTVDLEWHVGVGTTNNATINVGDTVRWTWTGALPHTVETSSGPTSFNSGVLSGVGQTFSYTFNDSC